MSKKIAIQVEQLKKLEPLASLSEERLQELAPLVYVEQLAIGGSLFREGDFDNQTVYLLSGEVQLRSSDGAIFRNLSDKSEDIRFPLDDSQPRRTSCSALSRVKLLRIDNSVLDYMMMWDQMAISENNESIELAEKEQETRSQQAPGKEEAKPVPQATVSPSTQKPSSTTETGDRQSTPASVAADQDEAPGQEPAATEAGPQTQDETASENRQTPAEAGSEEPTASAASDSQVEQVEAPTIQVAEQKPAPVSPAAAVVPKPAVTETVVVEQTPKETMPPQVATTPPAGQQRDEANDKAMQSAGDRSWIRKMRHIMAFKSMPPANIKKLLECMESIEVQAGETVIKQGEPGDYFYVLTEGEAKVTRVIELATIEPGRSFGEEALISEDVRNASVTMNTDGVVMRLSKTDFNELLQEPMLQRLSPGEAKVMVAEGAVWLDVRHAREYHHSHLPHAINIPLHELRTRYDELDPSVMHVCYCSTGKRSSAAAFLLAQKGFKTSVLTGGVKVVAQDLQRNGG